MVIPRPGAWIDVLPDVYRGNPKVAVVMSSREARIKTLRDPGVQAKVLVHGDVTRGLQIVSPRIESYLQHQRAFTELGIEMADPAYIGPLLDIPQRLLVSDQAPLLLLCNAMWRPYLDVVGSALSYHLADKEHGGN